MPKNTYRASTVAPLVTTGTATKTFAAIIGSATTKVTVTRIRVSCPTLTNVAYNTIAIVKNSSASTGGTSSVLTAVPLNTGIGAATAVVTTWTVDGTVGTAVGCVDSWRALGQATTAAAGGFPDSHEFTFGDVAAGRVDGVYDVETSGIVLNGVAEELSLQWAASTASACSLSISFEWIEEKPVVPA